ncbi:hypothetical protein [Bradyrhizobium sp. B117]|uniref:esterase/lipase family protein n=1 Tax=Bradyrhizobium sp. B117 TaxID=3140246 RepID=UPI0031837FFC
MHSLHDAPDANLAKQEHRFAIVFIHGIFSSVATFEQMFRDLSTAPELVRRRVEFWYYDYDFYDSLESNGERFASLLTTNFGAGCRVVIIAHSMGGLVSRLAVVRSRLSFVRLVFLLGTPNSGAVRLAQLGLLSGAIQEQLGVVFALFPRVSGIADLTRASKILRGYSREGASNAREVCYVSIPGLVFHKDQGIVEYFRGGRSKLFGVLAVGSEALSAIYPFFGIRFERPHDGIVEETSNDLTQCPVWHEKIASVGQQRREAPYTCLHVRMPACEDLDHMQIQSDPDIISTVEELSVAAFDSARAAFASCVKSWVDGFGEEDKDTYSVKFEA